jgi:hypothetical protein
MLLCPVACSDVSPYMYVVVPDLSDVSWCVSPYLRCVLHDVLSPYLRCVCHDVLSPYLRCVLHDVLSPYLRCVLWCLERAMLSELCCLSCVLCDLRCALCCR